jgi:hypothetical protein
MEQHHRMILMTNINPPPVLQPGAGVPVSKTAVGTQFRHTLKSTEPTRSCGQPLPLLDWLWGLADFRAYGTVSVTKTPLVWNGTSRKWTPTPQLEKHLV